MDFSLGLIVSKGGHLATGGLDKGLDLSVFLDRGVFQKHRCSLERGWIAEEEGRWTTLNSLVLDDDGVRGCAVGRYGVHYDPGL